MYPFAPMPGGAQETAELRPDEEPRSPRSRESRRVVLWRYAQARRLGLEPIYARLFAESTANLGDLRSLRSRGCSPRVALSIVL
jgi:hypothetical protein